jgi:hypothetical protein
LLDDTCLQDASLHSLSLPVSNMNGLTIIHFKGLSHWAVPKLVSDFLKFSVTIRTFIFEGYRKFAPGIFDFENCKLLGSRPASFVFRACEFADDVFCQLIDQICKLAGDLQRLTFSGVPFSATVWNYLVAAFRRGRSLRCMEVLEFDQITLPGVPSSAIVQGFASILKMTRSLRRFTATRFKPSLEVSLQAFENTNVLHEIKLRRQDFTEPLSPFLLGPGVYLLDFAQCRFTAASLVSLFTLLSQVETPITLRVADLRVAESGWRTFFTQLLTLPRIPLLRELDWSGNPLSPDAFEAFASYFVDGNTLRFLGLDRIFTKESIDLLKLLLGRLSATEIWGLSIRGRPQTNFGGELSRVIGALRSIPSLSALQLDGQALTSGDIEILLPLVENLQELSVDGTTLSEREIFSLYNRLLEVPGLTAIGRPSADLTRIFNGDVSAGGVPLESIRSRLQDHPPATEASVRAIFLCAISPDGALTPELYRIWASFPRVFLVGHVTDPFCLNPAVTGTELLSLAATDVGTQTNLAKLVVGAVPSPFAPPLYPPPVALRRPEPVAAEVPAAVPASSGKIPRSMSSLEAAYADQPNHPDLTLGIGSFLADDTELEPVQQEAAQEQPVSQLIIPPSPQSEAKTRKGIGYYQSLGDSLTINLDAPVDNWG